MACECAPGCARSRLAGPHEPSQLRRRRKDKAGKIVCPRGDLNPHALLRALAPQASASTYSATRTCGLLLAGRPRTIATGMVPPKGSNGPSAAGEFHKPR